MIISPYVVLNSGIGMQPHHLDLAYLYSLYIHIIHKYGLYLPLNKMLVNVTVEFKIVNDTNSDI